MFINKGVMKPFIKRDERTDARTDIRHFIISRPGPISRREIINTSPLLANKCLKTIAEWVTDSWEQPLLNLTFLLRQLCISFLCFLCFPAAVSAELASKRDLGWYALPNQGMFGNPGVIWLIQLHYFPHDGCWWGKHMDPVLNRPEPENSVFPRW